MDVLSRLAARALGVAPTMQPLIAPLFLSDPSLAPSPEIDGGVPDTSPHDGSATPVAPATARSPRPAPRTRAGEPALPAIDGPAATVGEAEAPHDETGGTRPWPRGDDLVTYGQPVPAPDRPGIGVRPVAAPESPDRGIAGDIAHRAGAPTAGIPPPRTLEPRTAARSTERMDRSGAAPQELSAPPFVPARTVRPLPAGIPDSVPQRVRETLAAIRRSAAPAVSDGESAVVRVSIGRIEVRSTPPTAPARPPLPAPRRRTSLADYLTGKRENRP